MSQIKVYLYFLGFNADDLKVFYDEYGIAAVSYVGTYTFLHDAAVIQHCFDEGYIERRESVAFALYAFTDDPVIAKMFELSRNSHLFVRKTKKFSKDAYKNLCRFTEARLSVEKLIVGKDEHVNVAMNQFEIGKISETDPESIISDWLDAYNIFEFLPLENGYNFVDDLLEDSLIQALEILSFKGLLGEEDRGPSEIPIQVNDLSVFYLYFQDTLS